MVTRAILKNRYALAGGILILVLIILLACWSFVDGFSNDVVDYANDHGGWALIMLLLLAVTAVIVAYTYRNMPTIILMIFALAFLILALVFGMEIPVADTVPAT